MDSSRDLTSASLSVSPDIRARVSMTEVTRCLAPFWPGPSDSGESAGTFAQARSASS